MPEIVAQFRIDEILDLKKFLSEQVRTIADEVSDRLQFIVNSLEQVQTQSDTFQSSLTSLEADLMAKFSEVMGAIQTNGLAIAEVATTVASSGEKITTLIQNLSSGIAPSEAELNEALDLLEGQSTQLLGIRDAALQLVPSLPSPEAPTAPGEAPPIPNPEPLPVSPEDVVIEPSDVGLPGTVAIDVEASPEAPAAPVEAPAVEPVAEVGEPATVEPATEAPASQPDPFADPTADDLI